MMIMDNEVRLGADEEVIDIDYCGSRATPNTV